MAESTPQIKAFLGFDGVGPRALTVRSKRNERSHSLTNEPSKDRQSHAPLRPLWAEGDPLLAQTGPGRSTHEEETGRGTVCGSLTTWNSMNCSPLRMRLESASGPIRLPGVG